MQVTVNDEPATDLWEGWEKQILLGTYRPEVSGSVLDQDAATDRILARFRIVCACLVGLIWLVAFGLASAARQGEPALTTAAWGLAVVGPALLVLAYLARSRGFVASLPERAGRSPPPGTQVRVDAAGLTIGGHRTAWSDVTVDRVDFQFVSGRGGRRARTYFVRQIDLRSKDFAYTIDGTLLDEGAAIVNEIYRRKFRPS